MRYIILTCITLSLCSCGASGKLLGTAVKLPGRIIKGGMMHNEDGAPKTTPILLENNYNNLSDID
ncbi:MAG: hypothetical protein ACRBB3_04810 [Alphaproteobacteria bacterium]